MGATLEQSLAELGLRSAGDLLAYRPFRYEPAAPQRSIAELLIGEEATIEGEVRQVGSRRSGRRLTLVEALVSDGSDEVPCVWFNQTWLTEKLAPGTRLLREWQGQTHHVTVLDHGFEYAGKTYRSLTAITRLITGTPWSGPQFFGLRS